MPSLDLNGEQLERLSDALRDAFTVQRLREMLKFKLGKRLDDYSLGSDYKEIVFELITAAEAEGWTAELLVAARQSNPGNARLQAVAEEVALAVSTPALERTIKEKNPFLDVEVFRTKLGEVEAQVCRVEIDTPRGTVYGTGFLLGPDVLMTNHHVMESIVSGKVPPLVCRIPLRLQTASDRGHRRRIDVQAGARLAHRLTARRVLSISSPSRSRARRVRTSSTTRSCVLPERPAMHRSARKPIPMHRSAAGSSCPARARLPKGSRRCSSCSTPIRRR